MNKLYAKVKGVISKGVGIPAAIIGIISINGEGLLIPAVCAGVVLAIMAWNGYLSDFAKEAL